MHVCAITTGILGLWKVKIRLDPLFAMNQVVPRTLGNGALTLSTHTQS